MWGCNFGYKKWWSSEQIILLNFRASWEPGRGQFWESKKVLESGPYESAHLSSHTTCSRFLWFGGPNYQLLLLSLAFPSKVTGGHDAAWKAHLYVSQEVCSSNIFQIEFSLPSCHAPIPSWWLVWDYKLEFFWLHWVGNI